MSEQKAMNCPVNCPLFKENEKLKEERKGLNKKHTEDIERIRSMLANNKDAH